MVERIGGTRPRPRVAIVGNFSQNFIECINVWFPTIWIAPEINNLLEQVHPEEIDLIILGDNLEVYCEVVALFNRSHLISFSQKLMIREEQITYPVRIYETIIASEQADTEEFTLPDLPLFFNHQRERDLQSVNSIRGWDRICYVCNYQGDNNKLKARFRKGK